MEYAQSVIAGLTTLGVVGIIAWGANSCSQQETALREACIRSGGSVIANGPSNSYCVRSGVVSQH